MAELTNFCPLMIPPVKVQEVSVLSTTTQQESGLCALYSPLSYPSLDFTSNSVHYVHVTPAHRHYKCHLTPQMISLRSKCQDDHHGAGRHTGKVLRAIMSCLGLHRKSEWGVRSKPMSSQNWDPSFIVIFLSPGRNSSSCQGSIILVKDFSSL